LNATPGRIVHFHHRDPSRNEVIARAALVTEVPHGDEMGGQGNIYLAFWTREQQIFVPKPVPFSEEPREGHWSWPPRSQQ
jgi:hypothetical protein